jgi:hypothetical protein
MNTRVSRPLAIAALLVAMQMPTVASAATRDRDGSPQDPAFTRIVRIVKHLLHLGSNDDFPSIPKP